MCRPHAVSHPTCPPRLPPPAQMAPRYPRPVPTSGVITASPCARVPGKGVRAPASQPALGKPLHEATRLERFLVTNSPCYSAPGFLGSKFRLATHSVKDACRVAVWMTDLQHASLVASQAEHLPPGLSGTAERRPCDPPLGPTGPGRAFPVRPTRWQRDISNSCCRWPSGLPQWG